MIITRKIERVTGREGQFLHYIRRTSRRPWISVVHDCPPFAEASAVFEIEIRPGKPDRYLRRVDSQVGGG